MRRSLLPVLVLAVAIAGRAALAPAADARDTSARANPASMLPPVKSIRVSGFGRVMATLKGQALYYWTPEKRSPGKIVCTGSCAQAWPVLYAPKGTEIQRRYPGFKGEFGTIRRPNGRLQVTYNRLPLYTYAHEPARVVRCDDVNGWFVVRVS
jgi:predicted lipoprotein with Yx(FWY)xxD motif